MKYYHPALEIIKGIVLFCFLWILAVIVAFGIYTKEASSGEVGVAWISLAVPIVVLLYILGYIGKLSLLTLPVIIGILTFLYFLPPNSTTANEAVVINKELSDRHEERLAYAKELFQYMGEKWTSPVRAYLIYPHRVLLIKNFEYFWNLEDTYVDSNTQAQMYRHLLLASERFAENEVILVRESCTPVTPHTFIQLKLDTGDIRADFWAADNFPDYEFGMYTTIPCTELHGEGIN